MIKSLILTILVHRSVSQTIIHKTLILLDVLSQSERITQSNKLRISGFKKYVPFFFFNFKLNFENVFEHENSFFLSEHLLELLFLKKLSRKFWSRHSHQREILTHISGIRTIFSFWVPHISVGKLTSFSV